MNKISDQIMEGMKTAMKAKDTVTLNTLRALKTALTNTAIAKGGLGTLLEEAEELAVVRKQIKQREDSAEQFRSAGRPELAEKEEAEIAVLKQFMPAELTAEETAAILETVMKETGASTKKDMGQVMKLMQERTAGRVNGKELARMVTAGRTRNAAPPSSLRAGPPGAPELTSSWPPCTESRCWNAASAPLPAAGKSRKS